MTVANGVFVLLRLRRFAPGTKVHADELINTMAMPMSRNEITQRLTSVAVPINTRIQVLSSESELPPASIVVCIV